MLRGLLFKWSFCKFSRRLSYNKGGVQTNKKWNQTLFATPNRTNYCFRNWPYSGAVDIRSSLNWKLLSIVHIGFALSSLMWGDWIGWNGHLTKHGIRFRCRQNAQLNKTRHTVHKFQIANYSALHTVRCCFNGFHAFLSTNDFRGWPHENVALSLLSITQPVHYNITVHWEGFNFWDGNFSILQWNYQTRKI